jgi:hypothetical protein
MLAVSPVRQREMMNVTVNASIVSLISSRCRTGDTASNLSFISSRYRTGDIASLLSYIITRYRTGDNAR